MTCTITFSNYFEQGHLIDGNYSEHEFPTVFEASEYLIRMGFTQCGTSIPDGSKHYIATYQDSEDVIGELRYERTPGRVDEYARPLTAYSLPVIPVTADDPVIDPTVPHDIADDFAALSIHEAHDRAMSQHEWEDDGTPEQMELIF